MGKFTGYLICTDCDGTLTYEPGKVSEENAQQSDISNRKAGCLHLPQDGFRIMQSCFRTKYR